MKKRRLFFVITQFYQGGAETALLNLLHRLDPEQCEVDFLVFDQVPLSSAVSLLDKLPSWVNVCDAAQGTFPLISFGIKAFLRIVRKLTNKQLSRPKALRFVKNKEYDWAFSYGEWMAPEFVAKKVNSRNKAIWIHVDIDKSYFVSPENLFRYDSEYTNYIFVSKASMESAVARCPEIRDKCALVYNLCADRSIREMANQPIPGEIELAIKRPMVVTVANIRPEKNHMRQIEAMGILHKKGLLFTWVNIGNHANTALTHKVREAIAKNELEGSFLLVGADPNPYKYMIGADAVAVLSDYESWSIVITEAKVLGVPVVATKTSGASEQLKHLETGVLTDFTPQSIADSLEQLITDPNLQATIRNNLTGFSTGEQALSQFNALLDAGRL